MKVAIMGAGAYGRALGAVARRVGHATKFFDPFVFPERKLVDVLSWAEVILLVTPAGAVEKLLKQFPAEAYQKPLIVATKGVMNLENYEKFGKFELISGPGFAEEILHGDRAKLTVATAGATAMKTLAEEIFKGEQITFDKTEDVRGVAILSGLKNIFAIEAGRREILKGEEEFKEYIFQVLEEAQKVFIFNGGFLETARLSAGVGDFVLTCGSEMSRNYQFGQVLKTRNGWARREFLRENTVEGVFAAEEIRRCGLAIPRELEILPDILRRIYAIKR